MRRASFAQLLCAAEDKQQRRRLARSSLKSWKKKKRKLLDTVRARVKKKTRNNRRIESTPLSILLPSSVSTLLRIPPPRRTSGKPSSLAGVGKNYGTRAQECSERRGRARCTHATLSFLFPLLPPLPVSKFNRGRVRAHTEET